MEASTQKAVAIGLAATCWVGAAGMSIADRSTLRDGVALGLVLAGLLALLWGWWPARLSGGNSAVQVESAREHASFSRPMEDASIKAVDAADRAAKAMSLDSVERAAGDFRSALAEIERVVEDTPSAEVILPLIQDLRRGSSPPYEFARPDFREKLGQLTKNRAVAERPRASTTAGLTWRIIERGMVAEKAVALLRVEATGELPQPLELYVRCAGGQATPSASLIPDPARPTEQDRAAELEVWDPGGAKDFRMKLLTPKLRPPSRLDIVLRSVGNSDIRVVELRRALGIDET